MKFNTDLYYDGSTEFFGGHEVASWKLWFAEDWRNDRQVFVEGHQLPVKPTKRQIRNLRRDFRKITKG